MDKHIPRFLYLLIVKQTTISSTISKS